MRYRAYVWQVFIILIPFLVGCTVSPTPSTLLQADTPSLTLPSMPETTMTSTPDPCTGWWCTVTGLVYTTSAEPGSELDGAMVTLYHSSYCSPTRGQQQTVSRSDGIFEFEEVFFHDTDMIRIEVTYEGYETTQWNSKGKYCLYCGCFNVPLEIVLQASP